MRGRRGLAVLVVLIATGCSTGNSPALGSATFAAPSVVAVYGLNFTIPAALKFRADGFASTGEMVVGYYGNVPLGRACGQQGCGLSSFTPLPANAVVIGLSVMSGFGVDGHSPNHPSPNTSIAGAPAVFSTEKPGTCGADESATALISRPSGTGYAVRACLRGPDLATGEQLVMALLNSATFAG